jgi:hypothetical protein
MMWWDWLFGTSRSLCDRIGHNYGSVWSTQQFCLTCGKERGA